jgi:preprotein translocase subunit SecB
MPKKRKTAAKRSKGSVGTTTEQPVFHFVQYNLLGLVFQQSEKIEAAEGDQPPSGRYPVQLTVNANVGISSEKKLGHLRLIVSVVPDPHSQPYNIVVDVMGVFSTQNGTPDQLGAFCRTNAPAILFPYIREIIARTTVDAAFGVVRLDPVNMSELLNQSAWSTGPVSRKQEASDKPSVTA